MRERGGGFLGRLPLDRQCGREWAYDIWVNEGRSSKRMGGELVGGTVGKKGR